MNSIGNSRDKRLSTKTKIFSCVGRIRTCDLQLMRLVSFQTALPRNVHRSGYGALTVFVFPLAVPSEPLNFLGGFKRVVSSEIAY